VVGSFFVLLLDETSLRSLLLWVGLQFRKKISGPLRMQAKCPKTIKIFFWI